MQKQLHWFIIAVVTLMMVILRTPAGVTAMPLEGVLFGNIQTELSPIGDTHQVSGRITENGVNLPNITVRLAFSNTPTVPVQTVTTGADGRYTFSNVAVGTYIVRPEDATYTFDPKAQSVGVITGSVSNVNFTAILREYAVDGGIVTTNGNPLAAIEVRLFELPNTTTPTQTVLTDSAGRYRFTDVTPGNYRVTPQNSAYTFAPPFLEFSVSTTPVALSDFEASLITYAITGRASDDGTGMANVFLTLATQSNPGTVLQTDMTDGNGDYLFDDVEPGAYRITPSLEDYLFEPDFSDMIVDNSDVPDINFEANLNLYDASGRITQNGTPLNQVQLILTREGDPNFDAFAFTNPNGEYLFAELDPGNYTVRAVRNGYAFTPPEIDFPIVNSDVTGLDFDATALTYSASGRIEHNGQPVEGVTVTLSISDTGDVLNVDVTDANGDYRFDSLSTSDRAYLVTPERFPYGFTPPSRDFIISIQTGNVPNLNFEATISYLYLPLTRRAPAPPPPTPTPSPTAIPCLVEINPNDNLADAENNAAFESDRCINGALPSPDRDDFYKIQFGGGTLRASLTGIAAGADYDLTLYEVVDGNAILLAVSNNTGNQNETLNAADLEAGVYYLGVQSFMGNSPTLYTLRWTGSQ